MKYAKLILILVKQLVDSIAYKCRNALLMCMPFVIESSWISRMISGERSKKMVSNHNLRVKIAMKDSCQPQRVDGEPAMCRI